MKKFLTRKEMKDRVKVLKRVKTSLLLVLDFFARPWLANLFKFLGILAKRLI